MINKDSSDTLSHNVRANNSHEQTLPRRLWLTNILLATCSIIQSGLIHLIGIFPTARNPLLRLLLGLCIGVGIICAVDIAYSRQSSPTQAIARMGLMRCEDLPCFQGIVPGHTSWTKALSVLKGQITTTDNPFFYKVILIPSSDGKMLNSILMDQPREQPITLNEVVVYYGAPLCVDISPQFDTVIVHYHSLHLLTRLHNRISPTEPILTIIVGNPSAASNHPVEPCGTQIPYTGRYKWPGFAKVPHHSPVE